MPEHSGEIASAPKGFHLAACKRSWKAGAPADEGCHPDCPRRLWAENERLRAVLAEFPTVPGSPQEARVQAALFGSSGGPNGK